MDVLYSYIIEPLERLTASDLVKVVINDLAINILDYKLEKRPEDGLVREEVVAQVLKHCLDHLFLLHHL